MLENTHKSLVFGVEINWVLHMHFICLLMKVYSGVDFKGLTKPFFLLKVVVEGEGTLLYTEKHLSNTINTEKSTLTAP